MSVVLLDIGYHVAGREEPLALHQLRQGYERLGLEFARVGEHVFPRFIKVFEEQTAEQFKAEGRGPNAGKWKPLSPRYAKRKMSGALRSLYSQKTKRGRTKASAIRQAAAVTVSGLPILVLSGRLRDAMTKSSSPFAQRAYSSTTMSYGTQGVGYASFHQTGTERMPDRPPFDFGGEAEKALQRAGVTGVRAAVKAARVPPTLNYRAENADLDAGWDLSSAGDT